MNFCQWLNQHVLKGERVSEESILALFMARDNNVDMMQAIIAFRKANVQGTAKFMGTCRADSRLLPAHWKSVFVHPKYIEMKTARDIVHYVYDNREINYHTIFEYKG